jgi:hypothetical protein
VQPWQQQQVVEPAKDPLPSSPVVDVLGRLLTGPYSGLQSKAGEAAGVDTGAAWRAALDAATAVGAQQVVLGEWPGVAGLWVQGLGEELQQLLKQQGRCCHEHPYKTTAITLHVFLGWPVVHSGKSWVCCKQELFQWPLISYLYPLTHCAGDRPAEVTERRLASTLLAPTLGRLAAAAGLVAAGAAAAVNHAAAQLLPDVAAASGVGGDVAAVSVGVAAALAALWPVLGPYLEVWRFSNMSGEEVEAAVAIKEPVQVRAQVLGWHPSSTLLSPSQHKHGCWFC